MPTDLTALAHLHARAFAPARGWSVAEFQHFHNHPHCHILTRPQALAVVQIVAQEAELLTLAVAPNAQGRGLGQAVLQDALTCARDANAAAMFLEVAEDNSAALALYDRSGFACISRRPNYYARAEAGGVDALILRRALT